MEQEIERLQWITLGSVLVLILLCAGLLSVVWLCLHLTEIANLLLTRLGRFTTEGRTLDRAGRPQDVSDSSRLPVCRERGQARSDSQGVASHQPSIPNGDYSPQVIRSVPPGLRGEHIASPYHAGQVVIAAEELNWIGGSGIVVPVGALLRLVACHDTQAGRRWSATWKKCHLSSIPEDMLAPLRRFVVKSEAAVDHAQCEREYLAQQHGLTTHQPTASG